MASAASYRILSAAIIISCLIHIAVLRVPLHGKAIASPVHFHLSKVLWHSSAIGNQHSSSKWFLTQKPAVKDSKSNNSGVSIEGNDIASDAVFGPTQPQEIAWLPLESRFYPAGQLSKRPRVIDEVDLETADTRSLLATGKMVFNLVIDNAGLVLAVDVEQTDLPEIFTTAASNAFMKFKFEPGELDGTPVGSILRIEITYDDAQLPSGENSDRR